MRSHLEFEWRRAARECVAGTERMETPCPARRPCIIRYKSPVRHQSHYTIELTPGESFQQTADDDAEDTNRDIGNRVKHPKFNSNLPVSFNWSHHTRLNGSKNSPLFNCGSICMLNVLSAERQEVRPSVRPSVFCVYDTFSFQWPSQARNVRREPCDRDLSWPAKPTRLFLHEWRGVERRKEIKGQCCGASARDDMVVDGHRTLSVWWPSGWMSGFPRRPCITAQQPGTSKQWQQLERHVDDIISKCAHL
jgi:hypothetical protein